MAGAKRAQAPKGDPCSGFPNAPAHPQHLRKIVLVLRSILLPPASHFFYTENSGPPATRLALNEFRAVG